MKSAVSRKSFIIATAGAAARHRTPGMPPICSSSRDRSSGSGRRGDQGLQGPRGETLHQPFLHELWQPGAALRERDGLHRHRPGRSTAARRSSRRRASSGTRAQTGLAPATTCRRIRNINLGSQPDTPPRRASQMVCRAPFDIRARTRIFLRFEAGSAQAISEIAVAAGGQTTRMPSARRAANAAASPPLL